MGVGGDFGKDGVERGGRGRGGQDDLPEGGWSVLVWLAGEKCDGKRDGRQTVISYHQSLSQHPHFQPRELLQTLLPRPIS